MQKSQILKTRSWEHGRHCFASCSCRNGFPVTWSNISLVLSYSWPTGQRDSTSLVRIYIKFDIKGPNEVSVMVSWLVLPWSDVGCGRIPTCREENNHSEDLGVDGEIVLYLREIGWEIVHWIHLAQDRDQYRAVLNTVIKLQVPWKGGEFLD